MAQINSKKQGKEEQVRNEKDSSKKYARDFMALRSAIIENCRDCIRDCGKDCLDNFAMPLESIRCPLQKVRIDYKITIQDKSRDYINKK